MEEEGDGGGDAARVHVCRSQWSVDYVHGRTAAGGGGGGGDRGTDTGRKRRNLIPAATSYIFTPEENFSPPAGIRTL